METGKYPYANRQTEEQIDMCVQKDTANALCLLLPNVLAHRGPSMLDCQPGHLADGQAAWCGFKTQSRGSGFRHNPQKWVAAWRCSALLALWP